MSPRQILRHQIARAAERGFTVLSATELEFFLFRDTYEEAQDKGWQGLTPHSATIEDYQLLQTSREEYVLKRIRQEMCAADIPVEFSKGEAGRGQHEVNVTYAGSLETADRHLVFKNGIKEIAAQEGRAATFMAKWSMDDVGSSCHVHNSLWDAKTDAPLMADPSHPSGLSTVGRRFLAGQLHAARQLAWCAAPTVNSYRRYVPGSWAPTAIVWGEDNRTCGFRIVGHGAGRRIETRVPGADVNPYLVVAACIAAGLYGIDHELELPERLSPATPTKPPTCPASLPPWSKRSASWRAQQWPPRPSGPTCTITCSTRLSRSGRRPTVTCPTGSWPATSNACRAVRPGWAASLRPFRRLWMPLVSL